MSNPVWTEIRPNGLTPQLDACLKAVRAKRNFNPKEWVVNKAAMLNTYMRDNGLKACTISVSGGVDSAVMYSPASNNAFLHHLMLRNQVRHHVHRLQAARLAHTAHCRRCAAYSLH